MKRSHLIKTCVLAIMAAVLLAGCSSPDLIIMDTNGKPIAGAKVIGASLSTGGQSITSDAKGQAKIPWALQETKWISVYKDGFRAVENIDAAQKKPIIVKMTQTNG